MENSTKIMDNRESVRNISVKTGINSIPPPCTGYDEGKPIEPKYHKDLINPEHYKGEIECIDAIKSSMTDEQFIGYLKGSIMKYVWREKDNKKEDLEKAKWFINKYQEQL